MKTLQALSLHKLSKHNALRKNKLGKIENRHDFVKYVIYVVVIKICGNVYASYRCYLFYQNP